MEEDRYSDPIKTADGATWPTVYPGGDHREACVVLHRTHDTDGLRRHQLHVSVVKKAVYVRGKEPKKVPGILFTSSLPVGPISDFTQTIRSPQTRRANEAFARAIPVLIIHIRRRQMI